MNKKWICLVLFLLIAFLLSGCGNDDVKTTAIDLDLSQYSTTMAYSELYNINENPTPYIGSTIKVKGTFAYFQNPDTKEFFFACLVYDPTGCCSAPMEFVLAKNIAFPKDYPDSGTEITISGKLETYKDGGIEYCHLVNATMTL